MIKFHQRIKLYIAAITCLLLTTIVGCGPNSRITTIGNVKVSANLNLGLKYISLTIGTADTPFSQNISQYKNLMIKLADGHFVALGDLTVEMIKEYSSKVEDNLDSLGYSGWPAGSERCIIIGEQPLFFTVNKGKILQLYSNSVGNPPKEKSPTFKISGKEKEYPMPFSHQDVLDLFGEPDKINDFWKS